MQSSILDRRGNVLVKVFAHKTEYEWIRYEMHAKWTRPPLHVIAINNADIEPILAHGCEIELCIHAARVISQFYVKCYKAGGSSMWITDLLSKQ